MGNLVDCKKLEQVLSGIMQMVSAQEAELQADGKQVDGEQSRDYALLMERRPIVEFLKEHRQKYQSSSLVSNLIEVYRLQKTFASISAFQNLPRCCETARESLMQQVQRLSDFAKHSLRHLLLIPPAGALQPVTLDAGGTGSLQKNESTSDTKFGPLPLKQAQNLIHTNNNGVYSISIDGSDKMFVDLEIGDDAILISLPKTETNDTVVDVYFNGISRDCKQAARKLGKNKLMISHDFENPEFMNVTVINGVQPNSLIMVFWAGIEKQLITHILEEVYTDSQQRLAWWWKPQEQLGGWSPVQCIQERREDAVLNALCSQHNIKDLLDLSR